ncbi:hypothetical protein G5714_002513 [Onychostoma macrolepis]|uniref:DUF6589 domain-containing protein n=1 Tax=Onychostoma macrolepis TaxID=369639 RepID=A0A7J6D7Q0_9TELE|nr:hypothetical protein G5714_002513 [Onychostoma macrolepis]
MNQVVALHSCLIIHTTVKSMNGKKSSLTPAVKVNRSTQIMTQQLLEELNQAAEMACHQLQCHWSVSDVMAHKTEITLLGLLEVDEKVSADMVKAMQYINQRYIPYTSDLENGNDISKPVVHVILAGDQLTKQNTDAAIRAKANEESSSERMERLVPAIADFHCSMNFNDVIFKRFYNPSS